MTHSTELTKNRSDAVILRVARLTALACSLAAAVYTAIELEPLPIVGLLLTSAPAFAVIL